MASEDLMRLKCSVFLSEGIAFWKTHPSIIFVRKISCFPQLWLLKMSYLRSRSGKLRLREGLFFIVNASLSCVMLPELNHCTGLVWWEAPRIPGRCRGPTVPSEVALLLNAYVILVRWGSLQYSEVVSFVSIVVLIGLTLFSCAGHKSSSAF